MFAHLRGIFVEPNSLLNNIAAFGARAAVLGFFLISGYSIAHSYTQRPEGYFQRRFLRIYPLYCAAVLFTLLVVWLCPKPAFCLDGHYFKSAGTLTSVANFFLLQEFISIPLTYDGALWSLSIEVFYYLLAPWLYRRSSWFIAFCLLVSMAVFQFVLPKEWLFGYPALVWLWPWLIGFLIGRNPASLLLPLCLGAAGAIVVFLSKNTPEPLCIVTYLVTFTLILLPPRLKLPPIVQGAANFLGDLSYPLYLFHLPLAIFLFQLAGVRSLGGFVVGIIGFTIVFWYLIDLKLKRLFWIPVTRRIVRLVLDSGIASRFRPAQNSPTR